MKIQLLYFDGCPNVDAARAAVRQAIALEAVDVELEEIDVEASTAPAWARAWGSPTILVDGHDVAGQSPSGSYCCRLYAGGVPSVDAVRLCMVSASRRP
jgi:mercuric ion transport protein